MFYKVHLSKGISTRQKEIIPTLGVLPVKHVTRKEVIEVLDEIAFDREAITLSNRVRATLSSIFSFGVDKAIVDVNPVLHIKRKKNEIKRDRVYSKDEIILLWNSFNKQNEPIRTLYKILLLCGQRSGETRRMKWSDLNLRDQLWIIPEQETKALRKQVLPLTQSACKMIEMLYPITGNGEYVFNSPRLENRPIEWLQKATDRIKRETGIDDFRVHDLRRTMASNLAQLGTDRTVLGKILNHKGLAGDNHVTAIYDRYDYLDERREALMKWDNHLKQILLNN